MTRLGNRPSVTFIMPVYNGEQYVTSAIQSILHQTTSHWELLIVDDVSTDHTLGIVKSYDDTRIRTIEHHTNLGLYGTLLDASQQVRTDLVCILMQDDRIKPDYLESMLTIAQDNARIGAFFSASDEIRADGRVTNRGVNSGRIEIISPGVGAWKGTLRRGCFWIISGSLTRTDVFERLPFRRDLPHCGDYDWLLRYLRCEALLYYERPLVEIRIHPGQASANNLRHGVDLEEAFAILDDNMRRYRGDLTPRDLVTICGKRSWLASRRAVGALRWGHVRQAGAFARRSAAYAGLGLRNVWSP